MTTPGGFEYTDDSVVARVSVDIPSQAVTDIAQLTSAMSAMRTELEAISRAQSDWLSYLQQMPVIVEQSNQALRNQITLMERMSYLQAEVGSAGSGAGGGFSGGQSAAGTGRVVGGQDPGNGGAAGGYSTAAPAGYRNPFADMLFGVGGQRGAEVGSAGGGGGEQDVPEDPRTLANMAASRGIPVNLGMLTGLGAIATTVLGMGNDRPGSTSPQDGNSSRTSGSAPDPDERGQPSDSDGQDDPGGAGRAGSPWQFLRDEIRKNIKNEKGEPATDKQIRNAILKKGAKKLFGRGAGGTIGKMLRGGGLLVGGLVAAHQIQNIGEDITEYQQLGSVRGGDYMTGMGMELENRVRALDPFVNLPQTREAMQAAYSNGFMGESVSQVQDQAIANFKELGMSMQETARMMAAAMYGKDRTNSGETLEERTRLDAVLRTMKDLSANGGLSSDQRRASLAQALTELVPGGMSSENVEKGELLAQEAYGNTYGLGERIGAINKGIMNNQNALAIVGQRVGITGIVPGAMKRALSDAGYNQTDITTELAKEVAKNVSGLSPKLQRVGTFMDLMNQMGAELTYEDAEKLYDAVSEGDPAKDARDRLAHPKGNIKPPLPLRIVSGANDLINKAMKFPVDLVQGALSQSLEASMEAVGMPPEEQRKTADLFKPTGADTSDAAPPSGGDPKPKPVTMGMSFPGFGGGERTEGTVTGNVTITVDQAGRVTAPPSIVLTGTQRSSQSGHGSAQMNNPSPGDPDYFHSAPPFGGR